MLLREVGLDGDERVRDTVERDGDDDDVEEDKEYSRAIPFAFARIFTSTLSLSSASSSLHEPSATGSMMRC